MAGDVPVTRGDGESGRQALEACGRWLRQGMPVMIFPEGTRSRDGQLQAFKDGAFRLAIEHQCPILPLALVGTREALVKGSWKMNVTHAEVRVLDPIETTGLSKDDIPALRDRTRDLIAATIALVVAGATFVREAELAASARAMAQRAAVESALPLPLDDATLTSRVRVRLPEDAPERYLHPLDY